MRSSKLFSVKHESVFKNELVLYPEFVPSLLLHRDNEIDSMVYAFNPVLEGKKPLNVFLTGSTGTGKTVSVRFVLRELENTSDRGKHLYLNCFEYNTRAGILFKLANFLGCVVPRRGMSTDELFEKVVEYLKKADFIPIVVLDEVDQLLLLEEESKILYDLLRINEYAGKSIGLVLISNDLELKSKLDDRIKSSLTEEAIEFNKYTPVQLKDILWNRAKIAFFEEAISKEVIDLSAAHSAKLGGDARIALSALLKAGRIADKLNSPKLELIHLNSAFSESDSASKKKAEIFLNENEKNLMKLISDKKELNSGELYELYSTKFPSLSERTLREIINSLESKKLISSEMISLGNKGKTRKIKVNE
ncbi:MAG: AAA family ATPase [Candidatus Diapherotrites archaeon]|nr:AAA family ATPase [Candidatus Diapherotrites archaeon]